MNEERKKIKDEFNYTFGLAVNTNGLFMPNLLGWNILPSAIRNNPATLTYIDECYFTRSNEKYISNYIVNLLKSSIIGTSSAILTRVANVIKARYESKWKHLFDINGLTYAPIDNYDMREVLSNDNRTITYNNSETRSFNGRETNITRNETRTPNLTSTENADVYGFNSSNAVPSGKRTQTQTGTETTGDSEKQAETGSEIINHGGNDQHTHSYTLTRSGNIGVTTSQQMIESEIALWKMWDVFEQSIYPDIDKIMCLKCY